MAPNDYTDGPGKKAEPQSSANESISSQPGVRSAIQTRGGVISGRVVTVLIVSVALALVAMVISFVVA
jgi:hypothetical protein